MFARCEIIRSGLKRFAMSGDWKEACQSISYMNSLMILDGVLEILDETLKSKKIWRVRVEMFVKVYDSW